MLIAVTTTVGVPRIELGSYAPEAYIIPLYDTPTLLITKTTEYIHYKATKTLTHSIIPLKKSCAP